MIFAPLPSHKLSHFPEPSLPRSMTYFMDRLLDERRHFGSKSNRSAWTWDRFPLPSERSTQPFHMLGGIGKMSVGQMDALQGCHTAKFVSCNNL